ncbi:MULTISPECIES: DUF6973 domain-containing protein [Aquimarina]|uniref:DUF6973 domain-containing protein n=1 Tax=Aquimarina algiphila TaxID=2047982 RepID=A0A554VKW1_9FLAO|nr:MULTISPECIES: hypothetical protein [Aquimarina]TSE08728.1 hypothetical protein FOF46_11315 [Aquimarina algiphila]
MNVWNVIRGLSIRQIFRLARILILQPLLIYPTLKATRQTIKVCDLLYQKKHHKNGKANAFRHGLWNLLICQRTFRVTKSREKSIIWAKKITDLHEKLAPNDPLETAMDLHNNEIGRAIFYAMIDNSEEEMIAVLKENTKNAKKIIEIDSILDHKKDLVYLSED